MKKNSRFITKYTSLEDPTHLPTLTPLPTIKVNNQYCFSKISQKQWSWSNKSLLSFMTTNHEGKLIRLTAHVLTSIPQWIFLDFCDLFQSQIGTFIWSVDEKGLVLDNTKHIFEHNKPAPGLKDDLANRIKEAITWEESQALQRPNFLMCSTPKGDRVPAI